VVGTGGSERAHREGSADELEIVGASGETRMTTCKGESERSRKLIDGGRRGRDKRGRVFFFCFLRGLHISKAREGVLERGMVILAFKKGSLSTRTRNFEAEVVTCEGKEGGGRHPQGRFFTNIYRRSSPFPHDGVTGHGEAGPRARQGDGDVRFVIEQHSRSRVEVVSPIAADAGPGASRFREGGRPHGRRGPWSPDPGGDNGGRPRVKECKTARDTPGDSAPRFPRGHGTAHSKGGFF